jgi:hypothetical protein
MSSQPYGDIFELWFCCFSAGRWPDSLRLMWWKMTWFVLNVNQGGKSLTHPGQPYLVTTQTLTDGQLFHSILYSPSKNTVSMVWESSLQCERVSTDFSIRWRILASLRVGDSIACILQRLFLPLIMNYNFQVPRWSLHQRRHNQC